MNYQVIHIVKRFGRVGGMESYVWHLAHGLARRGIEIVIGCEQVCELPEENIPIIQVEGAQERPRWKSMRIFRARVDQKMREVFGGQRVLIHSHERSLSHQVTTFHGPPIDSPKGFGSFWPINRRIKSWQQMELAELLGSSVQMVLPVSSQIRDSLLQSYPGIKDRKLELAWPGVSPAGVLDTGVRNFKNSAGIRFAFIGREWKRKGLDIAVQVVGQLRKAFPGSTLSIFGVCRDELPAYIHQSDWVIPRGWVASVPWSDLDLLIHPAKIEPFGMVISEARSHGVPVVMSSSVGAADLRFSEVKVVDRDAPLSEWCKATQTLLCEAEGSAEVKWTWDDLVNLHLEKIYPDLEPIVI